MLDPDTHTLNVVQHQVKHTDDERFRRPGGSDPRRCWRYDVDQPINPFISSSRLDIIVVEQHSPLDQLHSRRSSSEAKQHISICRVKAHGKPSCKHDQVLYQRTHNSKADPAIATSPTRMNLTLTKQRLKGAQTGHSLLAKKRDALMNRFRAILRKVDEVSVDLLEGIHPVDLADSRRTSIGQASDGSSPATRIVLLGRSHLRYGRRDRLPGPGIRSASELYGSSQVRERQRCHAPSIRRRQEQGRERYV